MLPAEHVQRQITVIVVIAVIEAPFLMPVQPIIGGVQIQHHLIGSLGMRFQEQIHQQPIDALRVHHDLLGLRLVRVLLARTAVVVRCRQLQAVERALAGQGLAAILCAPPVFPFHVILVQGHGQHGIAPQFIVVIEVRIAQRQPEYALPDQIQQRMLDLIGLAVILEAGGEAPQDAAALLQFPQHQHSAIGGDAPPSKRQTNSRPPNFCAASSG